MVLTFRQAAEYALSLEAKGWAVIELRQFDDPDDHTYLPDAWHVWASYYPKRYGVETRDDHFNGAEPPPENAGKTIACPDCRRGWPVQTYERHLIAESQSKRPIRRG